jgi:hypothetical protein
MISVILWQAVLLYRSIQKITSTLADSYSPVKQFWTTLNQITHFSCQNQIIWIVLSVGKKYGTAKNIAPLKLNGQSLKLWVWFSHVANYTQLYVTPRHERYFSSQL